MKTTHALGLAPLVALALMACSTSGSRTSGGPVGAGTSSASATAVLTTAATTGGQVTPPATPARCVSANLRASLGQTQGAAGHSYIALLLTNRSRIPCTLSGYPGVSFTAGADGHQIGVPAQRDHRFTSALVTLVAGASVHATVEVANYANYDQKVCQPVRAAGFRVFPPGASGPLIIGAPQTVCAKPGVQSFQTSVVRNGTSPD